MMIIDRMTRKDKANYRHLIDQVSAICVEAKGMLQAIQEKVDVIKDMEL